MRFRGRHGSRTGANKATIAFKCSFVAKAMITGYFFCSFVADLNCRFRGKWNDQHCNNPEGSYAVCQAYQTSYPKLQERDEWPSTGGCPDGFVLFGKGCFRTIGDVDSEMKTVNQAQLQCKSFSPYAELAVLHIQQYEQFATALLKGFGANVWIGLSAEGLSSNYDLFKWSDGSQLLSTNWAPDQPNKPIYEERQVRMYWNGEADSYSPGQWSDEDPNEAAGYMCSVARGSYPEPGDSDCPTGWFSMFAACYKFVMSSNTADGHHTSCGAAWNGDSNYEAYLVSIHDQYENSLVAALSYDQSTGYNPSFVADQPIPGFWIGFVGQKQAQGGGTVWSTMHAESLAVYSNWGRDEPADIYQDRLCAYIDQNGVWHSADCSTQLPGLCKATSKGVYDDHTSDRGDYIDCKNGWHNSIDETTGHYCVKAFEQKATQQDASDKCAQEHGGSLVSIHSAAKNQRIGQITQTRPVWIGLEQTVGWGWSDGSAVNYENWRLGEPSVKKQCAHIADMTDKWMSVDCEGQNTAGFVCQIPRPQTNCAILELERQYDSDAINMYQCMGDGNCWDGTGGIGQRCYYPIGKGPDNAGNSASTNTGVTVLTTLLSSLLQVL